MKYTAILLEFLNSSSKNVFNDNKPLPHFVYGSPVERQSHHLKGGSCPAVLIFLTFPPRFFWRRWERWIFIFFLPLLDQQKSKAFSSLWKHSMLCLETYYCIKHRDTFSQGLPDSQCTQRVKKVKARDSLTPRSTWRKRNLKPLPFMYILYLFILFKEDVQRIEIRTGSYT